MDRFLIQVGIPSDSQFYNMYESSSRTGPARFGERKPLLETHNQMPSTRRTNQEEEICRITAKIRSLEDDIRSVHNQNRQIQAQSKYLVRMLHDLEDAVDAQAEEIQQLTQHIQAQSAAKMDFSLYESTLRSVGEKVESLHKLIAEKNKQNELLRGERQQAMLEHLKLKEECNILQYQYNSQLENLDQLVGLISSDYFAFSQLEEQKVDYAIDYCRSLQQQTSEVADALQNCRKEGAEAVIRQKEKRIQCQYNLEEIKQKWKDYQQKKAFYTNCYNEQSVQAVIDDMVQKETLLRGEIFKQQEKCQAIKQQTSEALICFEKRKTHESQDLHEEISAQRMQNEIAQKKKERVQNELRKIYQNIRQIEEEGFIVTQQIRGSESQIYQQIGEIQSQNMTLEKELAELKGKVDLLQLELLS